MLSAEHAGKYKPALSVYKWAAEKLNLTLNEILLVTAHGWDIAGGENAGMQTAYMIQPNQMLYSLSAQPDYMCKDLADLATQLSSKELFS